jgi:hypothetical protein
VYPYDWTALKPRATIILLSSQPTRVENFLGPPLPSTAVWASWVLHLLPWQTPIVLFFQIWLASGLCASGLALDVQLY